MVETTSVWESQGNWISVDTLYIFMSYGKYDQSTVTTVYQDKLTFMGLYGDLYSLHRTAIAAQFDCEFFVIFV